MQRTSFLQLSTAEIAQIIKGNGLKTVAFPINGTRRWILLERIAETTDQDFFTIYLTESARRHVELYQLIFDHGIEHLLTPIFGPDILERGDTYMKMAAPGMAWLVENPIFTDFYDEYEVQVAFYGDYHRYLDPTPYAYLADLFDSIHERTRHYQRHHLYYGVFAHDPTVRIGEFAIQYHGKHGHPPDRETIVEMYYGTNVPPLDVFIGFEFSVFDVPLVATGNENIYFTVSPSPYLTAGQFQAILYDHLYVRPGDGFDYEAMTADAQKQMRDFYRSNQGRTLGIGKRHPQGFWYPLPDVELTLGFDQ